MEVADHCVAPPLHHKADYVQIHLGYEDRHGPSCEEVEGADVGSHEPDEWACCPDNSLDGGGDIGTVDLCPCPDVLDTFNGGVTGGTVASKMYHTAMYLCHWTPYGKAGAAVPNKFTINVIFCVVNTRLKKSDGVRGSLEGVMFCVSTTFAVFSWVYEEEECNPGEVAYGYLTGRSWLEGGVQSMDNLDG